MKMLKLGFALTGAVKDFGNFLKFNLTTFLEIRIPNCSNLFGILLLGWRDA